jgi:hypothetical protein
VITLMVSVLRLVGELMSWSPVLFNPEPGGAGALVGIVWLVPIFGLVFAVQLVRSGMGPDGIGRVFGYPLLGIVLMVAGGALAGVVGLGSIGQVVTFGILSIVALCVALRGWPALGKTLLAYGLAARIPVVLIMLAAILGDWGTHYDAAPPDFPAMGVWGEFLVTGLIPQLTFWIAFTVIIGSIFGGIAAALMKRKAPATT